jgi:FixJ family two-component response regulator
MGASRRALVAVVDDDAAVRAAISSLLRSAGYQCATFDSAEVFFASACVSEIDCVLLDIRMPGMSGLDLHAALIQMNHRAPVLYVTATHDSRLRERALSLGAAAFLAKTLDDEHLLNTIQLVLNRPGRARAEDRP